METFCSFCSKALCLAAFFVFTITHKLVSPLSVFLNSKVERCDFPTLITTQQIYLKFALSFLATCDNSCTQHTLTHIAYMQHPQFKS